MDSFARQMIAGFKEVVDGPAAYAANNTPQHSTAGLAGFGATDLAGQQAVLHADADDEQDTDDDDDYCDDDLDELDLLPTFEGPLMVKDW